MPAGNLARPPPCCSASPPAARQAAGRMQTSCGSSVLRRACSPLSGAQRPWRCRAALIQLVSRNPLGDPHARCDEWCFVQLAALVALPAGFWLGPKSVQCFGALASMTLRFHQHGSIGRGSYPARSPAPWLCCCGRDGRRAPAAAVSFMLAIDFQLRNIVFWLLGDLNGASMWWLVAGRGRKPFAMAWPRAGAGLAGAW